MTQDPPLIDPALLENLTEAERKEALAAAAAAKRAEERAEQRALERAMRRREEERRREKKQNPATEAASSLSSQPKIRFVPKLKRGSNNGKQAKPEEEQERPPVSRPVSKQTTAAATNTTLPTNQISNSLSEKERLSVRAAYLGKSAAPLEDTKPPEPKRKKTRLGKSNLRFEWDETDDTLDAEDDLYNATVQKRRRTVPTNLGLATSVDSVKTKPVDRMTNRDWRIFRENYEIVVRGGKAPPPLRSFRESPSPDVPPIHAALLDGIENVLKFKEPTPIQRQAIPIGLQRRDMIGIAETGSGKTVAFGVPLCNFLLNIPDRYVNRVAEEGPLALVMAPTRELALQIEGELKKLLSQQRHLKTFAIVGGQPIQQQAYQLRQGVHLLVGTPGRINDCIEMAYLVLNQCCSVVLDECDRMIDMGFAPQVESILDAMGGMLKSESENEAYRQEMEDRERGELPRHRLTAMFSATMPLEVERIARKYLRHPAVVSIGDQDSSKNARIVQKIVFLSSPKQKEKALRDILADPRHVHDKVIVFVNEKKHADGVGRMVERMGRSCVVLHGGKSQEQREENLAAFRKGGVVMVATDVAGRGLDIPDVTHVINFDLPTRSIENYSHRIGRTGRAGKEGLATSFITDEDEGIMAPLKAYLESTRNPVPDRLARHPAASANTQGNLIH